MRIEEAPGHVRKAHDLMVMGCSTREMAVKLKVTLKTAASYRNKVNRIIVFNRPWERKL